MHRTILTALVAAALSLGSARSAEKPVKIYIFAGQSNMEARYGRKFLEEQHPELLRDKKIWQVEVGQEAGPIQNCRTFGVDRSFVYRIAEATDQEIIVLRCAVGGTVLQTRWRPPTAVKRAGGTVGPLYLNLVKRFHNLIAHLKEVYPAYHGQGFEVAGFIWFQGESDSCSESQVNGVKIGNWNYYEANLRDLIQDVRRDFGVPDLPVLLPQINVSEPWEMNKVTVVDSQGRTNKTTSGQIIRDIQQHVAESTPNCVWVKTLGLSKEYHYDAAAYVEIGRRMAQAMMPFARQIKPTPAAMIQNARTQFYERMYPDLKPDTRALNQGLVAYFHFDEGAGQKVMDSSSRRSQGELVGNQDTQCSPQWTRGLIGSALKFSGGAYVRVPEFTEFAAPGGKIERLSVSYWIQKTSHCGYGPHLARRTADRQRGWWIDEANNGNSVWFHFITEKGEYSEGADGSEPLTLGDGYEWHHIAAVFDGPNRRFDYYFDGKKLSRKKVRIQVDGKERVVEKRPEAWQILAADEKTPLRIGEQDWFGDMRGPSESQSLDEVALWDRALTEAEIEALYNNGHGVKIAVLKK